MAGSRDRRKKKQIASVAIVVLVALLGFGTFRIREVDRVPAVGALRIAMVQGNIPQSLKWDPENLPPSFKVYNDASESAARQLPDLIIWPETAAPFIFLPNNAYPEALAVDASYQQRLLGLARGIRVPILFGAPSLDFNPPSVSARNRVYLVSAEGRTVDFYDKIVLVPFSEYVPLEEIFGRLLQPLVESPFGFVAGDHQTIFEVKDGRLAVLVCYESILPDLTRRAVKAGANVLVNLTNDAWFTTSSAPYQLLAMTVMRSVETHTPMVRVANTGISAIVSPTGRIVTRTELFTRTTQIGTVEWKGILTFYTEFGDVFAGICFGLLVIGLLVALLGRE